MPDHSPITTAIGPHHEVPPDWMSATGAQALVLEDPALVWLRYHGQKYGFEPDSSPYEFLDFIGERGQQFEEAWIEKMAPEAVQVCVHAYEVRSPDRVRETFELMQKGAPVIVQAALWWAPERIYGVPDVLARTSWLQQQFPDLAGDLDLASRPDHYVVFDMKFTSDLTSTRKDLALASYAAQVRIYSYILGHLQGVMPWRAYLVTRDRVFDPLPIEIASTLDRPLDKDLAAIRDQYVEIKVNGANYLPWRDEIVASNIAHHDERWRTAKRIIAQEKTSGGDSGLVYRIGPAVKRDLDRRGFPTLDSLLEPDPITIPLEKCEGLGPASSKRIRAILKANRSGSPVLPSSGFLPERKEIEFFVDFEYFTDVNVDFSRQWPTLEGCEMIFMIGLGWEENGNWSFRTFEAKAEDHDREREMLGQFMLSLQERSGGAFQDGARTALYHWTDAEVWQASRAADRHGLSDNHPLRGLPWCDLHELFLDGPITMPGAWTFQLKDVTRALGRFDPRFHLQWPGDLDQGLRAMVMGWRAYEDPNPLESEEMGILRQYLEADCKALHEILRWLRSLPL